VQLTSDVNELKEVARKVRIDIVTMLNESGSGHPGGSLSAVEIAVSLYFSKMNHSPEYDRGDKRDRFILSKGHAAPLLYSVLAQSGYFPHEELMTLRKLKSRLSGHPYAPYLNGIEVTTGSLGQGLSQANGLALSNRLNNDDSYVYALLGDGESQEGQIWEAAMFASHNNLNNVIAFLDNNGLQIDGEVKDVMGIEPIGDKWRAFGWNVIEIDGHDFGEILSAIDKAKEEKEKPTLIWSHTVKGKGVSFMENSAGWHGKAPSDDELAKALEELVPQTAGGN